ncbi:MULTISPECIES: CDC48 family AAA ATPase [Methanosarcina]|uniref:Cell division protein FtsH n=3 Tax=Methanosarcina barkeri TaxID=2208 RepID=A0A0E3QSW7_METBA|nr:MULTISPECIES: CDC48 family AAA ATPase [Methanosarcina]AKB54009.1 Cell division protein FtsH [Methanosarcina barkeri MS]AKB57915.1 Cell division protein FtsH [Methanosarcina barkeri 227]AKJ38461.1 cell division control protein Cdc48 [Methanosarcina barkeri CM1]OEC92843.1 ATPase [Methanosarcina sp. A14]
MEEIQLKVEKAYPIDLGRGIIRLDPTTLLKLQLSPGDIVEIRGKKKTTAKVWRADRQDWDQGLVRIDNFIRQNAGVSIGEKVTIKKVEAPEAKKLVLALPESMMQGGPELQFGEHANEIIKRHILKRPVFRGDIIPIINSMSQPMTESLTTSQVIPLVAVETDPANTIVLVTEATLIELRKKPVQGYEKATRGVTTYEDIGGLGAEIMRVREMIELPMKHPELFAHLNIEPPKGVILYGPPGTGKTLIAKAVANESGASFHYIAGPEIVGKFYGESEERLRKIFEEATQDAPSVIFIDEIDSIAPKRENVTGEVERRVVAQLLTLLDGMVERGQVVVIGATNRVDAIDPALRRPGRFDREIHIGVPDTKDRYEILQIHTRGMPIERDEEPEEIEKVETEADEAALERERKEKADKYLMYLAERTQGFVGADLLALVQEAAMRCLRENLPDLDLENEPVPPERLEKIVVTKKNFEDALMEAEPSALREIYVEMPTVSWNDVGGLDEAKQSITEAVEWPIKNPEKFAHMGIKAPRGILLYGPPGTGKTLIAKAVAKESNANFISVKGPEIFSKWLGESEKAIRETFRKARQVAPCVIFFDEIDSIASMPGMESTDSHTSERVLNQLLTEMDGLESLRDVVVIAATNRPNLLDPAILRPGRFDRLVYIGSPDKKGRLKIFRIHTKGTPLADDVDLEALADITEGYVGADIESVCREAVMIALRENFDAESVEMRHFREALKKVKPTITENIAQFYEKIEAQFKGGQRLTETAGYIGYR